MAMLHKLNGLCYRDGVQISEREYAAVFAEVRSKAALVSDIYAGRTTIDSAPEAWREEILRRVDERRQAELEERELSAEEALSIILGGDGA